MSSTTGAAGLAALPICEKRLLALTDRGLLPGHEVAGVLRDAAAPHENTQGAGPEAGMHRAAAALINTIFAAESSLRRPSP